MKNRFALHPIWPVFAAITLSLTLGLTLGGCGMTNGLFGDGTLFGGARRVEFNIAQKLNNDYPVAVELLVLYDADLEEELLELSASRWFDLREQYKRDFSSDSFESWKWEWTPGQQATPQAFRYNVGALSTLVFASYAAPGDHRIRVEPNKNLRVILHQDRFAVKVIQ